ncbi:MAG TPA: ferredoxin reductase family protein [Jatrophihabitans sp.]|nr:ferredoxin reductase family protein [Jatrophihabitans sp.]
MVQATATHATRHVVANARTSARPRVSPRGVLWGIALGALAVVGLWWRDTTTVSGLGDWLTNAGRITGLLAGYAVVVLLVLMARIPPLDRGLGTDRLARWHAHGGRYTVCLAVAHTLLIIWGYAVLAHTGVVSQTGTLLTSYPDVLMATVALGLLVAIGIASARAARRRLRYETWHYIHLYTYLAIALAFSHQFATGADFRFDAAARWAWSALYVVVAALLVWYRLLTPVRTALRHRMRVVSVTRENEQTVSVAVTGRDLDRLRAEPGQFFRWRFLAPGMWWAANPYSLSAPPRHDVLRLTAKVVGDHSAALLRLPPGTRVLAEGPYGGLTAALRQRPKVVLLAGGIGITPLRALFESLPGGPGDITLLYRVNTPRDIVLREELDRIAQRRRAQVHYLVGPPRHGANDHLSARRLQRLVPDLSRHDVYLCGPEPMMDAARESLLQAGVPKAHIHNESFEF